MLAASGSEGSTGRLSVRCEPRATAKVPSRSSDGPSPHRTWRPAPRERAGAVRRWTQRYHLPVGGLSGFGLEAGRLPATLRKKEFDPLQPECQSAAQRFQHRFLGAPQLQKGILAFRFAARGQRERFGGREEPLREFD